MMFAVLFEDDATRAEMRRKHMDQHRSFLARNAAAIHAAGPLVDARNSEPAGGLWLVEAQDLDAVRALYEQDPFWPTGLRKSVRVLEWRRVFADGQNLP
jgi:uncharacterized protein YciI